MPDPVQRKPVYIAIDLKSYYASVECVQLHQNPLTFNLLVADESRTDKTICLAVSPSLKAIGVPAAPDSLKQSRPSVCMKPSTIQRWNMS